MVHGGNRVTVTGYFTPCANSARRCATSSWTPSRRHWKVSMSELTKQRLRRATGLVTQIGGGEGGKSPLFPLKVPAAGAGVLSSPSDQSPPSLRSAVPRLRGSRRARERNGNRAYSLDVQVSGKCSRAITASSRSKARPRSASTTARQPADRQCDLDPCRPSTTAWAFPRAESVGALQGKKKTRLQSDVGAAMHRLGHSTDK